MNDTMQEWAIFGSNDGLFYSTIAYEQNISFLQDVPQSFNISDTTPYKNYVFLLSGGFTNMTGKALNLSLYNSPTGLSSFVLSNIVAMNTSVPALNTELFVGKWFLVLISGILIVFGLRAPLSSIMGSILIFAVILFNYSSYSFLEVLGITFILFTGIIITAIKLR
jgi:hypothetical protein